MVQPGIYLTCQPEHPFAEPLSLCELGFILLMIEGEESVIGREENAC